MQKKNDLDLLSTRTSIEYLIRSQCIDQSESRPPKDVRKPTQRKLELIWCLFLILIKKPCRCFSEFLKFVACIIKCISNSTAIMIIVRLNKVI